MLLTKPEELISLEDYLWNLSQIMVILEKSYKETLTEVISKDITLTQPNYTTLVSVSSTITVKKLPMGQNLVRD